MGCTEHHVENSHESHTLSKHWPAFSKLFQTPRRSAHHSDIFFPAEYEYLNHLFPAHPDVPKILC